MAMKIPSAGNPFGVDVARSSVEGLVTPSGSVDRAQAKYSAFQKQVDDWNAEQDELAANDLINQIRENDEKLKNDEAEGWANQRGKNAVERESGKSLGDENGEKRKTFLNSLNLGAYSYGVRKKVLAFNDAQDAYVRRDINRHLVRENQVFRESVDQENMNNAFKDVLSGDAERVKSGLVAIKGLEDMRANRAGVKAEYKALGSAFEMLITNAVEANDFGMAENLLKQGESYLSPAGLHRQTRAIKKGKEGAQQKLAVMGAVAQLEMEQQPEAMAAVTFKQMTGLNLNEEEFKTALQDADGDVEVAMETVAMNHFQKEMKGADPKTVQSRAAAMRDNLKAQIDLARNASVDDTFLALKKKYPTMPDEMALTAARKVVVNRQLRQQQQQADRDEQAATVTQSILAGASYDDIPELAKNKLSKKSQAEFALYSQRRASGTLADDVSLVYDLKNNPKRLVAMTDEEFLRCAARMSPATFDELTTLRNEIKSGARPKSISYKLAPKIRDAMSQLGIGKASGTDGKTMAGMAFEILEQRLVEESNLEGRELTAEEVTQRVGKIALSEFEFPENWGWDDKYSVADLLSGKRIDTDNDVAGVLDAGLKAMNIYDPSDINRTRLMTQILLLPDAPIEGAELMAQHIKTKLPAIYRKVMAGEKRSFDEVDKTTFVQTALKEMSAYKQTK